MFFLKKLPTESVLREFAHRYPEMRVSNVLACLHLLRVASELLRKLEEHFRESHLSLARFLALIVLEREDARQLKCIEMTEALGISKPNMTRLLESLEVDALIERRQSKEDKRSSLIAITRKGSKMVAAALPGYYRITNKAMEPLDGPSKNLLIELLGRVEIE
jgi:DNA-binding MarR family transcriptional regulator